MSGVKIWKEDNLLEVTYDGFDVDGSVSYFIKYGKNDTLVKVLRKEQKLLSKHTKRVHEIEKERDGIKDLVELGEMSVDEYDKINEEYHNELEKAAQSDRILSVLRAFT